jgi:glycosyltransferase involved in cell wall biosynthesis
MGWSTYHRYVKAATLRRDDIEAEFLPLKRSYIERLLTHNFGGKRVRRALDPMVYLRWVLERWWRQKGRRTGFDAIHVASQVPGLAFAELAPAMPYSLMIDATRKQVLDKDYSPRDFSPQFIERDKRVLQNATAIASMSSWAAGSLMDDYDLAEDKIHVIPPSLVVPPARKRMAKSGDLVRIGFVGNAFVRKGGPTLLELHQERYRDRAELWIVSRRFQPSSDLVNVRCFKHIPNHRIFEDFYPQLDIFCLPTEWDMSPWVTVEASAAGLPVVTSRVGGVPDLCRDGETGFLIPPGDVAALDRRLGQLIDDPALRLRLGEAGRRFVRNSLNAEANYNRLIDIILSTC